MKLLRYGPAGAEKPAMLDGEGVVRDLSGVVADIDGRVLSDEALARLRALDPKSLPAVGKPGRIGACVGQVGKFICIGLNYSDHAAETGATPPGQPIIFHKAVTALCGPNDDVLAPPQKANDEESSKAGAEKRVAIQQQLFGGRSKRSCVTRSTEQKPGHKGAHEAHTSQEEFHGSQQWRSPC